MTTAVQLALLLCSLIAFVGAGAAVALRRHHELEYGNNEGSFMAVATMLVLFGALCAAMVSGLVAVLALLIPIASASYAYTAQRLGLFRIVTGEIPAACPEESELRT